jgi:hypothetical protein
MMFTPPSASNRQHFPNVPRLSSYLDCEFFRNRHNDSSSSGSRNNIGRNQFCLKPIRKHQNCEVGLQLSLAATMQQSAERERGGDPDEDSRFGVDPEFETAS